MKIHPFTRLSIWITCVLILLSGQYLARAQEISSKETGPTTSAFNSTFTYQGQLLQNSQPINGTCDFQFSLWDAVTNGNQIGSLQTSLNVPVVNGLFVVSLDFGDVFDGDSRWLEMAVSCPAGGAFTPVTPRQELTATPYALHAATAPWDGLTGIPAGFADGIDNSATYTAGFGLSLNGTEFAVTGAPWSGLTGVPAGFADGIDNDTTYTAGVGLTLSGTQFTVTGAPWSGLTGVPAGFADGIDNDTLYTAGEGLTLTGTQFGLSFAGSGSANTASRSDHNHNGVYAPLSHTHSGEDITSGTVADARIASSLARDSEIMPIVLANDGSGSGLDADLLDGQSSSAYTYSAGEGLSLVGNQFSMQGSSYQQVVMVAKSGGDYTTIQAAIDSITDASATKRYLVWVAPGIYSERVAMKSYVDLEGAGTTLTRITYSGSSTLNTGTLVAASNSELRFFTVENTGGSTYAVGVYNASTSYFSLFKVQVTASGGVQHYAVYNNGVTDCIFTNSALAASGTQGDLDYGIYNNNSSLTVQYSQAEATGGGSYGIYNQGTSGSYLVIVRDSQITGSSATLHNDTAYSLRVAGSQLEGGAVSGSGITCAGVYDENYTFSASTCP